jgi:photosystem II stability/assembly factor-like uncharacterized protein
MSIGSSRAGSWVSCRRNAILGALACLGVATGAAGSDARAPGAMGHTIDPRLYQALRWRNIGPFRGGRTTAVAGVPSEPATFYIGSSGGGVWMTVDAGETWHNISDGFFRVGGVGAIAVAPSDPHVIYVGTGESSVRSQTTSPGDGIYKSTDGGRTWTHVGLVDSVQTGAIVVDPRNPDIVYVAAQGNPWRGTTARGVYRSRDGGKTWRRVLFVNETTGAHDLSIDPGNPQVLYAALWDYRHRPWTVRSGGPGSGLWKSTDGGDHWRRLRRGLPRLMGNTSVSVSPADPNRVYAMIEAVHGGVYRSEDTGQSWQRVNASPAVRDRGWYYTRIIADPVHENTVYVLGNVLTRSTDGGKTLRPIANPHGDNHALWINPRNDQIMVESSDGGGFVTQDGGRTWSSDLNQPTGQFYHVFVDDSFPYRVYGAQQDWGTVSILSRTLSQGIGRQDWHGVGGGESGWISANPHDPQLVYATGILGQVTEYDATDGEIREIPPYAYFEAFQQPKDLRYRSNWDAQVLVSMHDPKVIYYGAQAVLMSQDRGNTWKPISPDLTRHELTKEGADGGPIMLEGAGGETYDTITYMAESPQAAGTLWVGTDDGLVHVTLDGGRHWANVTPAGLAHAQVECIEVSPHDPAEVYLAATRYKFGDFDPMLFRTMDDGHTWQQITRGLPAHAFVRVVREDPVRTGLLYLGTERGMFISFDDGSDWQPFQLNLPMVPVTDLRVHDGDLVASTQGRALWILDDVTALQQIDGHALTQLRSTGMYLFKPRRTYRLDHHYSMPLMLSLGSNPPDGALIRYELSGDVSDRQHPLVLEVLDDRNRVIRRFTSAPVRREVRTSVKGVQVLPPAPPLPAKAGMNTYVWNLRVGPYVRTSDTIRYVSQFPYRVAPGEYEVRLTYDGRSTTQSFEVVNDPRHAPHAAAQWQQQQALLARLRGLADDINRSTNEMRSIAQQVGQLVQLAGRTGHAAGIEAAGHDLISRIARWEDQVPQPPLPHHVQDPIGYPSRLLTAPVLYLIHLVDQDPPVTAPEEAEAGSLESRWSAMKASMRQIRGQALPAFENRLRQAGISPHIVLWHDGDPVPPRVAASAGRD